MRLLVALLLTLHCTAGSYSQQNKFDRERSITPRRPVHTFSIVARDPNTGELGVAVQSHWFSVGARVPWAEAGIGAVATQSFVDPSYGPLGLDLMRTGKSAPEALKALLAGDDGREARQVAMIDAQGDLPERCGRAARARQRRDGLLARRGPGASRATPFWRSRSARTGRVPSRSGSRSTTQGRAERAPGALIPRRDGRILVGDYGTRRRHEDDPRHRDVLH